ncbi:MAG: excisionase family DNA-binding protein [Candidatus Omnitrophota bacterium]
MNDDIPVIKLKGTYLAETFAARIARVGVEEIRKKVSSKELRGFISSAGEVSVLSDDVFFTPESMASIMHVSKEDVIDWIKSGELKATQSGEDYRISYEEYSRFGQSGMWMGKFHDRMFEYMGSVIDNGRMIEEVNEGFRRGMKPHIDKAREVIEYLEQIHTYYEKNLDILNGKSALVVAFIIMSRMISILYSALNLIEAGEIVGASVLFRSVYEGENLAKYFIFSEGTREGQQNLNKWLNSEWIRDSVCRKFLVKHFRKAGFENIDKLQELQSKQYDYYSKLTHLNYNAIMESYNAYFSSGPGGDKVHRIGFDYKSARLLRKSVGFLGCFEGLLQSVIITFLLCFQKNLPLESSHIDKMMEYNRYYQKSVGERNKELKS